MKVPKLNQKTGWLSNFMLIGSDSICLNWNNESGNTIAESSSAFNDGKSSFVHEFSDIKTKIPRIEAAKTQNTFLFLLKRNR